MKPDTTPAEAEVPAAPTNPWRGFVRRHLFDYPAAALATWLAITGCGVLAFGWALWRTAQVPATAIWPLLAALALVVLASSFALKLPRSAYTLSVADVFIFGVLASLGPPAAVLAAGIEGVIGTARTSKRLSSRIASPAAAMAAMAVCGWAFEGAKAGLPALGLGAEVAPMMALGLVALIPFLLTTVPLMSMMALKRGTPLRPVEWLADSTWMAAVYLGAALFAGIVHLNAQRFGQPVLAVSAVMVLGLVLLLRATFNRQETERQQHEAKVAQAQREAEVNQQRFTAAFSHAAIGMAIVRPDGEILQVNDAFCELFANQATGLVGQRFEQLLHDGDAALFRRRSHSVLQSPDDAFSMELRARRADGGELWVAIHCSQYDDGAGNGHCLICQLHDITSRHLAESRLQHIAYHDGLTDLANRNCFHERLEVAVEQTRLDMNRRFAVLFLDLDRFKIVNDSLGHLAGNELLRAVASRLRACVRPIDLVARLGGDEFAILLEALHDAEAGMRMAESVLEELSKPLLVFGTELAPGASVGITFSDLGYRTVDEILRDADLAMYEAKAGGRGRVAVFDSSMHERVAERLALESDLRRAIGEGQLSVQFQPIYELEPYRLCGFEALARWVHPERGPISPAVFIALAEESGRIEALTDWIIDHAVAELARWRREAPHARQLSMHVNISGRDLARASLVSHVHQVLQRHHVEPAALTLEITETTLMGRLDIALRTMGSLRASGVRFSIDDFGTGYSSLAYLGSLPIDSLKIDRSFVMGLHEKQQNVEIVRAILTLGQSLGRRVIAEGIETTEQMATLRDLGVPAGQGYLLSRPLRAEHVRELLALAETATTN